MKTICELRTSSFEPPMVREPVGAKNFSPDRRAGKYSGSSIRNRISKTMTNQRLFACALLAIVKERLDQFEDNPPEAK